MKYIGINMDYFTFSKKIRLTNANEATESKRPGIYR